MYNTDFEPPDNVNKLTVPDRVRTVTRQPPLRRFTVATDETTSVPYYAELASSTIYSAFTSSVHELYARRTYNTPTRTRNLCPRFARRREERKKSLVH